MMSSGKNSVLYINSNLDRRPTDPLDSNQFTTYLANPIKSYTGKVKIKLQAIELSAIFYSFSEYNNMFYFKDLSTNTNYSIEIPSGEYFIDGQQFVQKMNPLLTPYQLQFFYNNNTAKLSIQNNRPNPIRLLSSYRYNDEPAIVFDDAMLKLGFIEDYRNTQILPTQIQVSESPLRLISGNCVYLTCSLLSSQAINSTILPSPFFTVNEILGKVPTGSYGDLSQLLYASDIVYEIGNNVITNMKFSLLDESYNPITTFSHPITLSILVSYE